MYIMYQLRSPSVLAVSFPVLPPVSSSVGELAGQGRLRVQELASEQYSQSAQELVSSAIEKASERVSTFGKPAVESRTPEHLQISVGNELSPSALSCENLENPETFENPGWSLSLIHHLEVSENQPEAPLPSNPQPPLLIPFSTPTQSVGHHPEVSRPPRRREPPLPSGFMEVSPGSLKLGTFAECELWKTVESFSGLQSVHTASVPSLQVPQPKEVARPSSLRTFPVREYDPDKRYVFFGEPFELDYPIQNPREDPRFVWLEEGEEPPESPSQLARESLAFTKLNQTMDTQSTLSAVAKDLSAQCDEVESQFGSNSANSQERSFCHQFSDSDSERSDSVTFQNDLSFTKGGSEDGRIPQNQSCFFMNLPTAGTPCVAGPRQKVLQGDA